ncbi:MAG: hypothetical protein ACOYI5_01810 [Christensenellales bacterium]|jgi:hypothetical protein
MYFLLGREIGNGYYDFVCEVERMALTDDPSRAQQISEAELELIDMDYLMERGFYAMEIDRFGLRFSHVLLFRPPMPHYRPLFMPERAKPLAVRQTKYMQLYRAPQPPAVSGKRHGAGGKPRSPGGKPGSPDGRPGNPGGKPKNAGGKPGSPGGKPGTERRAGVDRKPMRDHMPGGAGKRTPHRGGGSKGGRG